MLQALRSHWPEYLIEAACLGLFMVSANVFTTLIFHPASPFAHRLGDAVGARFVMGLAMGGTAIALIFSPWGKRSGAHMNPATTLTFFRLGRVGPWDAAFYVASQFGGGLAGTLVAAALLSRAIADPTVDYAVTVPGPWGPGAAFVAEIVITFVLMLAVLVVSNTKRWARFTGFVAGALVAVYITFESPISGMSMNPARTLGSAVFASRYTALWIYFTAPLAGMLLAAEAYVRTGHARIAHCAKHHHENDQPCIFRCRYGELR
ncbi:MAG TPA: aquaporin [Candidatus Polarisedimenticolaceae bacterium]|nr:aquaporin [Candidatus Polarisedimenticolaceae bacterium]